MICKNPKCNKEFIPVKNAYAQKYCSLKCNRKHHYDMMFKKEGLKMFTCLGVLCRGNKEFMTTKEFRICPKCKTVTPNVNPLLERVFKIKNQPIHTIDDEE